MANATIVAGLGYGDEGKGAVVSFLTEQLRAKLVVRFNGGAQAAHNVVAPDGRHHTFAQVGSGTFSGVPT
jgi:adenylosuccinate synthase